VGVAGIVLVHSDDVGPLIGEEYLADMGHGTRHGRRSVNHQVDVVRSVRGVARENGLEFCDTS
jgi:hypothetical protein